MSDWVPPEVVGLCPLCRDEMFVPHGGPCPDAHDGASPALIEYYRPAVIVAAIQSYADAIPLGAREHDDYNVAVGIRRMVEREFGGGS